MEVGWEDGGEGMMVFGSMMYRTEDDGCLVDRYDGGDGLCDVCGGAATAISR